jgi:mono/diheme cytochrome c family protein
MEELLRIVAELRGLPAGMIQRSAEARAKAEGSTVEDVLRAWAEEGGVTVPRAAAAPAEAAVAPAPQEETAPDPEAVEVPEPEAVEPAAPEAKADSEAEPAGTPKVEVLAGTPKVEEPAGTPKVEVPAPHPTETPLEGGVEASPSPAEVEPAQYDQLPALAGFPRWLAMAFVVVPAIALLYALVAPGGPDCGASGALAIDPETGLAENCDGTPYGAEPGALGAGEAVFAAQCAVCHGATGGGGVGPALAGGSVLATFSQCGDHIAWVTTGSNAWPEATYGDTAKPVLGSGAAMPGFGALLGPDEIAAVALYERVAFGEEPLADAEAGCLAAPADTG